MVRVVRPPKRYGSGYREAGWATQWKETRNPWHQRVAQLCQHDPLKIHRVRWCFTLEEIAAMYLDYLVNQLTAYDQLKPPGK